MEVLHRAVKGTETVYFGLLFSLVWNSSGFPQSRTSMLIIHPRKPLVGRGGSIQLNCSMDCPGGKVQWEGLDTDLGNVISTDTYSILTVTNAAVSMEGVKFCTGQCQRKSFQKKVDLKVYSFPDTLQLETQPKKLIAGQSARLFCSVNHVYPPGSLTLSWFQGDDRLLASKEEEEEEEVGESKEQLFVYRSELEVPTTAEHTTYKCEAKLDVGQQTFHLNGVVTVGTQVTQVTPTVMQTTSTLEPIGASHGASAEPSTTIDWKSSIVATAGHLMPFHSTASEAMNMAAPMLESRASTNSPTEVGKTSTGLSSPAQNLVGGTSRMASTSIWSPTSTFPLATETVAKVSVTLPDLPVATQQSGGKPVSTDLLSTMDPTGRYSPSVNPGVSCRPVITTVPRQGTTGESLRISCHAAECSKHVQVRWVETPIAQSQYHKEEAEGHSILTVESISVEHQGVYRCITLGSQPRMAKVHIVVSPAVFSTSSIVTIGTAGSLMGLIVAGYVSHRLRRRSS